MRWGAHRFRSWVSSRKTNHRASAEGLGAMSSQHRSQSVFFHHSTPSRQSWRGRRIAHSILAWQQDCPKNPSPGQRRRSVRCCPRSIADGVFFSPLTRPAVNPAVATGLLHPILLWQQDSPSILLWQQDCFNQSCAGNRIAPAHYEQLGLGTVLF